MPTVQACALAQGWHCPAPEPHAAFELPSWHSPVASQQPEQLLAEHFEVGAPQPVTSPEPSSNDTITRVRMVSWLAQARAGQVRATRRFHPLRR